MKSTSWNDPDINFSTSAVDVLIFNLLNSTCSNESTFTKTKTCKRVAPSLLVTPIIVILHSWGHSTLNLTGGARWGFFFSKFFLKFWPIFGAQYKFCHILNKNFEKKKWKLLQHVVKEGGHSVRDCRKLVVNYLKEGHWVRTSREKGGHFWERVEETWSMWPCIPVTSPRLALLFDFQDVYAYCRLE